jgi:hypothetical protein
MVLLYFSRLPEAAGKISVYKSIVLVVRGNGALKFATGQEREQ